MTDDHTPADHEDPPAAEAVEPGGDFEQLKQELAEWRDKALRAAAEAENTRRRAEREANDARAYAIQRFARDLFEPADSLERALLAAPREDADPGVHNFLLGIEMTEKALRSAFERNGLKRIDPSKGSKFDPHLHQAMMEQEDPTAEAGAVLRTMQAGYELFGRVVRPAMVIVAAKSAGAPPPAGGETGGANPYAHADGAGKGAGGAVDTKL
jgi:molecular chaperone GrpE